VQSIIVDAGPLIALFQKRDKHHSRVTRFLSANPARLVSTLPVVTEACYFLNAQGKTASLVWIQRGGLALQPIEADDLPEIAAIIRRYADREIAALDVMTIDRRDFEVYRARGGRAFNLVLS
jgi:hypothetical protein